MDGNGLDTTRLEVLYLVLHQCDERSHDQSKTILHHRWYLETDGLATSCRKYRKGITARQGGLHHFLLYGTEGVVAPVSLQYVQSICHIWILISTPNHFIRPISKQ